MKNKESQPNILSSNQLAIMQPTAWEIGSFQKRASYYNKSIQNKKAFVPTAPDISPLLSPVRKQVMEEIARRKNIQKNDDDNFKKEYGKIPQQNIEIFEMIARAQARHIFESNREANNINDIDEEPMDFSRAHTYEDWLQIKKLEQAIKQSLIEEALESMNEEETSQKEQLEELIKEKERRVCKWEEEKIAKIKEKKNKEKLKTMQKQAEIIKKMNKAQEAFEEWREKDEARRRFQAEEKKKQEQTEKQKKEEIEANAKYRKQVAEKEFIVWKEKKEATMRATTTRTTEIKENKFPYTIHDIFNVPAKTLARKIKKRKQKRKKKMLKQQENVPQIDQLDSAKPKITIKNKRRDQVDDGIHIFDEISSIRRIGDNSESGILFPNKNQLEKVEEDIHNTSI